MTQFTVGYDPVRRFGTLIAEDHDPNTHYSFDIHVVFKTRDGRFFYGHDAGCSCPSPWEGYGKPEDFTRVFNLAEVVKLADEQHRRPAYAFYKAVEAAFKKSARGGK